MPGEGANLRGNLPVNRDPGPRCLELAAHVAEGHVIDRARHAPGLLAVDPDARTIDAALDLPSRGDTCFPEAVELGDDLLLYNYSSDPEGPDVSWVEGQKAPTYIVRQIVRGF